MRVSFESENKNINTQRKNNMRFDIEAFLSDLDKNGIKYERSFPLSEITTFKIGGPAAAAVFVKSESELIFAIESARAINVLPKLIGRGSNLLCSDDGYDGIIIVTDGACRIENLPSGFECECGASLTSVANAALSASLTGAEFMYGIPGSIGGGVFMNAGAYGGQISDVVKSVRYINMKTGERGELSSDQLDFSYRHSCFSYRPELAVTKVRIELSKGDADSIRDKMKDLIGRRKEKQPLEYPSAGSTFKRCEGYFTAQLIDEAGLKGACVGGAQVSEKHAGFIINRGGATAKDVLSLIEKVKETIYESRGVKIECEVEYIG